MSILLCVIGRGPHRLLCSSSHPRCVYQFPFGYDKLNFSLPIHFFTHSGSCHSNSVADRGWSSLASRHDIRDVCTKFYVSTNKIFGPHLWVSVHVQVVTFALEGWGKKQPIAGSGLIKSPTPNISALSHVWTFRWRTHTRLISNEPCNYVVHGVSKQQKYYYYYFLFLHSCSGQARNRELLLCRTKGLKNKSS